MNYLSLLPSELIYIILDYLNIIQYKFDSFQKTISYCYLDTYDNSKKLYVVYNGSKNIDNIKGIIDTCINFYKKSGRCYPHQPLWYHSFDSYFREYERNIIEIINDMKNNYEICTICLIFGYKK